MPARNKPNAPTRLVGVKRAAQETGLGYTSLRGLVHRGEIPHLRVGRAMFLERRDLDSWIERQKVSA